MTATLLTEGDMLLESVLDSPEDDAPRLILADWLEEHGEEERALEIRHSVTAGRIAVGGWFVDMHMKDADWRCLLVGPTLRGIIDGLDPKAVYTGSLDDRHRTMSLIRRGFVHKLCLPMRVFLDHAAVIFSQHPIEEVVLTDKDPSALRPEGPGWLCGLGAQEDGVDGRLWWLMHDEKAYASVTMSWRLAYATKEDALAALSRACVQYGRQRRIRRGVGV